MAVMIFCSFRTGMTESGHGSGYDSAAQVQELLPLRPLQ